MTDYADSTNYEFEDLEDAVVGNPTKASELNATIENVKFAIERSVVGYAQQGGPNEQVTIDPSGFAIINVYRVCEKNEGELLIDPDYLPFDTDDSGQMTLLGRWIDIDFFGAAADEEEDAKTLLPGGANDNCLCPISTQSPEGFAIDRIELNEYPCHIKFWSGAGQPAYDSGLYAGSCSIGELQNTGGADFTVTAYAWVHSSNGNLYLRFQIAAGGADFYLATAIKIVLGPLTGVYS